MVSRDKERPFLVAVPTHISPGVPLFLEMFHILRANLPNADFLVPDVVVVKDKGLGPELEIKDTPMSHAKFSGFLRALAMSPPLCASEHDAAQITTYSLRRTIPSVSDRLRLPVERRAELGNWVDKVGGGDERRVREPMAVRYSDARLESSATTRRLLLLSIHKVSRSKPLDDEEVRTLAHRAQEMEQTTLTADWVCAVGACTLKASLAQVLKVDNVEQQVQQRGKEEGSDSSSSSDETGSDQEDVQEIEGRQRTPSGGYCQQGTGQSCMWCRTKANPQSRYAGSSLSPS